MFYINKITSNTTVDYAAEELKKYLRMMMPEGGDVKISYNPTATDGFRLGLMQDFSLDVSDAEDTALDDILYIDCDERGGIIAGDNPRSVLLSVYEYLRQNGCRWLMPTVDGEYIPMQDIKPVKYRFAPSMRYRGWCNEGAEYQQCMLDAIEFAPKVGMNTFMLEFRIPVSYYRRYYEHVDNQENRPPEPVTPSQVLRWKRQCEVEIAKRGLQMHDIGHGWNADPFGIDSSLRDWDGDNEKKVPEESRKFLALVNGERKLNGNTPNYTSYCMSNPEARRLFTKCVADYADTHENIDRLHVWLADGSDKQCECEECRKKTPSDWYMMQLNEVDEEMTRRGNNMRIAFIAYCDTMWAPLVESLKNQKRFSLLIAPGARSYTKSYDESDSVTVYPYERNNNKYPENLKESLAYLDEWKKSFKGGCLSYEYHFWYHQYFDPAMLNIAKIINEDVKAYKMKGVNGLIEDGSQRSFFPSGFAFYTYARTLFDCSLSYEEILEDYFSCAFGESWKKFHEYLTELSEALDSKYLEGQKCVSPEIGRFYSPDEAKLLERVSDVTERGLALIKEHYNSDVRVRTVSVRLLELHAESCAALAKALALKAVGKDGEAKALYTEWRLKFGAREAEFQPFFDHTLCVYAFSRIFSKSTNLKARDMNAEMLADS